MEKIKDYWLQFKALETTRKSAVVGLLVLFLIGGIGGGAFFSKTLSKGGGKTSLEPNQPTSRKPVVLSLIKKENSYALEFDPQGNEVLGLELEMTFEPAKALTTMTKGSAFNQYPVFEAENGVIKILALNLSPGLETEAVKAGGPIAEIAGSENLKLSLAGEKAIVAGRNNKPLSVEVVYE